MNNEQRFKQRLAERLTNSNTQQADNALWLKIESELTDRSTSMKSYWLIAASIFVALAIGMQLPLLEGGQNVQLSPELYYLDVELQQAIIDDAGSTRYDALLRQRNDIEHNQTGSYQL